MGWRHRKRNEATVHAYSAFLAAILLWIWTIKYSPVEKQITKHNCNPYSRAAMKCATVWLLPWSTTSISKFASHTVVALRTYVDLLFPWMSPKRCMDALLAIPPTWSGSTTKRWWGFSILLAITCNKPPSLMSNLALARRLHLVWTLRSFNVAKEQKVGKCIVSGFRKAHKILWHWLVNRYEKGQSVCNFWI